MKLDDAPWKQDPVDPELSRSRRFAGTDDLASDPVRPRADERHEHMMKVFSGLDSAVTKLGSRLDAVLKPERPRPTNGEADDGSGKDNYSIIEQRHRLYMQTLLALTEQVEDYIERVDL